MAHQFWAAIGVFSCAFLCAQTPEKHTVAGTVVNSVTGEPIPGALVIASLQARFDPQAGPRPNKTQRAVTDAAGRFIFPADDVMSGTLRVSHQGFHPVDNQAGGLVILTGDFSNTTVRLAPESVVTGRAVNSDGEPLSGMTVELIRVEIADGRRELREGAGRSVTDDQGDYRIWNLAPGLYYLKFAGRVSMNNFFSANTAFPFSYVSYGPVYFPSAATLDMAQLLNITAGQTINAPFRVDGRPAFEILGKMVNAPPQRTYQIRLLRGREIAASRGGVNMAAGTFQVADVVPGTYTVQIYTSDGGPLWLGEAEVTVGERILATVSVSMMPGIEVTGRVEGGTGRPVIGLLRAHRADTPLPPGAGTDVYALQSLNGFSFKGLFPGRYEIEADGSSSGYISSIRSGNVDVLAEGLTVAPAGAPEIVISLAPGGGTIKGKLEGVASSSDPLVDLGVRPGVSFNMILVGHEGTGPTYRIANSVWDEFDFSSIKPGDYTIYAWPFAHQLEFRNPAVLSALSQFGASVSVGEGETKEVTVKPIPPEVLP